MARYSDTLLDQFNAAIGGAWVSVVASGTGTLAVLTADDTSTLSNPFLTNSDGTYYFNTDSGSYDITYRYGGRVIGEKLNVFVGSVAQLPAGTVADALGSSTTVAPSQRSVTSALALKADASVVTPLMSLSPTASVTLAAPRTGVTDAKAAIVSADSVPFIVPPGLYLIASNLTIAHKVFFQPGARFVIPTGVTVTFSGGIDAPEMQIFNITGTGAVAGLIDVSVLWFNGDAWNNSARTDGRALAQKAYDACVLLAGGGSTVRWPGGFMFHDGQFITVTKGQRTIGAGLAKTMMLWSTTSTNGFQISTVKNATIEGIGCGYSSATILPTTGTFIDVSGGFLCAIRDIFCGIAWNGIVFRNGSASCNVSNVFLYECFASGLMGTGSGDVYVNQFLITTGYTYLTLTPISGTFVVGEHFTTGPAPATIAQINGSIYRVNGSTAFTVGATLTGSTSGATATVAAAFVPNSLGGIRLTEHTEAFIFTDGDVIGGQFSMITTATSNVNGSRPEYNKFSSVYFDSSIGGIDCQNSVEFDFNNCWFSGPGGMAGYFHAVDGFKFSGGQAYDAGGHGLVFENTATNIAVTGMSIRGNGTASAGTYSGLLFKAGCSKFTVSHCIGDDSNVGAGTQKFAVEIQAGASDRYSVSYNRFTSAQVSDGGTGTNKAVGNNF
jgi:hypothetical protein